jgi:Transposase, Mutator family
MKPPREFGEVPRVRYRPEVRTCPHCGAPLAPSHPVWRKVVQSLTGPAHVTSLGYRCPQAACAFGRTVYRSARAEARQVKGSGYGLDVVVRIGHRRFTAHRTRAEIWRELDEGTPVAISERHVQNLLEVYLALLRASQRDVGARVAPTVAAHGGLILAVDGLAPDPGDAQLWVVREVLSGAVLGAAPLPSASAAALVDLLRPVRAAGVPVLGVVSDAQAALRLAVADVFPGVPHQLCQWHALKEAAEPLWAADRRLVAEAKQALHAAQAVEAATRRRDPGGGDAASAVVLDAALALRQTVGERGALPFAFAAPRVVDRLEAVGAALDRCLARGGTPGWPTSGRWWATPWPAAAQGRASWAGCSGPCSPWPAPWSRTTPPGPSRPATGRPSGRRWH